MQDYLRFVIHDLENYTVSDASPAARITVVVFGFPHELLPEISIQRAVLDCWEKCTSSKQLREIFLRKTKIWVELYSFTTSAALKHDCILSRRMQH